MRAEDQRTESIFASLGRTVREIIGNAQEIIRSEVQLAKTEIKEEVRGAAKASAFYAGAGICALYALGLILLACVFGLSHFVQPWLAALIVGLVMAAIGGIAYMMARKETQRLTFKAEHTLETAKENVRWARNRFK
jgi:uncharacterized membrane protein YqjE